MFLCCVHIAKSVCSMCGNFLYGTVNYCDQGSQLAWTNFPSVIFLFCHHFGFRHVLKVNVRICAWAMFDLWKTRIEFLVLFAFHDIISFVAISCPKLALGLQCKYCSFEYLILVCLPHWYSTAFFVTFYYPYRNTLLYNILLSSSAAGNPGK
jgi:hypothetical protein